MTLSIVLRPLVVGRGGRGSGSRSDAQGGGGGRGWAHRRYERTKGHCSGCGTGGCLTRELKGTYFNFWRETRQSARRSRGRGVRDDSAASLLSSSFKLRCSRRRMRRRRPCRCDTRTRCNTMTAVGLANTPIASHRYHFFFGGMGTI